jgi:hypothetical protein
MEPVLIIGSMLATETFVAIGIDSDTPTIAISATHNDHWPDMAEYTFSVTSDSTVIRLNCANEFNVVTRLFDRPLFSCQRTANTLQLTKKTPGFLGCR